MTTQVVIKKEVEQLKKRLIPKKGKDYLYAMPIYKDQPHGKYGCQIVNFIAGTGKAPTEEQEIEALRNFYEGLPKHAKRHHKGDFPNCHWDYDWTTFEAYLKENECKCGKH